MVGHGVLLEAKSMGPNSAGKVAGIAGQKEVEADDVPPLRQQPFAQMGTNEPSSSRHDRAAHLAGTACCPISALNHSTVSLSPSRSPTRGRNPSSSVASEMSASVIRTSPGRGDP